MAPFASFLCECVGTPPAEAVLAAAQGATVCTPAACFADEADAFGLVPPAATATPLPVAAALFGGFCYLVATLLSSARHSPRCPGHA